MTGPTRGERNNNPGNIERNHIEWDGLAPDQSGDPRFCVFIDADHGIRALAKIIINYQRHAGLNTVRRIINRWAPPSENDTTAYVGDVAGRLGVGADDAIDVEEPQTLLVIVAAIIGHENGRCVYDPATIEAGVDMALA